MRPPPLRLADMVMTSRNPEIRKRLAPVQKFYVESPALVAAIDRHREAMTQYADRYQGEAFRLPYRTLWLEIASNFNAAGEAEVLTGFLFEATDDTFQRGEIIHAFSANMRHTMAAQDFMAGPRYPITGGVIAPITTTFDLTQVKRWFTGDQNAKWPFQCGRTVKFLGEAIMDGVPETTTKANWETLFASGHEWAWIFGFLMAMVLPKTIIEREDLSAYNQQQRRLMRHNKQRQEFHFVRISMDDQKLVFIGGDREGHHTPRGEHDVRGFNRHGRNGRVSWVRPHKRGTGPVKTRRVGYEIVPPSTL